MKCKFCGEELLKDYKFCNNCGMPVEEEKAGEKDLEYFEIVENKKENSKYDFSNFLEGYKEEEKRQREEIKSKRPNFNNTETNYENEDLNEKYNDFSEDLEDTKKRRLFERTDYDLFESIKKNKSKSFYEDEGEGFFKNYSKKKKSKDNINNSYNDDYYGEESRDFKSKYIPDGYIAKEDLKKLRRQDKVRTVYHIVFNILVVLILGIITYITGPLIQNFVDEKILYLENFPQKLFLLIMFLVLLFLFIPFFKCKGYAKVPLLIMSILISWTLIGWVILLIVARISNKKWDKRVRDISL
ncbi:MAG: hypothetical protein Q4E02_01440 [Lagierella massiliensis]|nr:hypothetical protein [Lagierella massiliensis]